jgi:hypothetical protein
MHNSLPMDSRQLVKTIENAKDDVGVITHSALHDGLGTLTPEDWKQASAIFSRGATTPDGFYIEDDSNGKVTIHNDLIEAHRHADNSVLSATLDDAKQVAGVALIMDVANALAWGATKSIITVAAGVGEAGAGALAAEALGAGIAAAAPAALIGGAVAGVIGAAVLTKDYVHNSHKKEIAQEDIRSASVVSVG